MIKVLSLQNNAELEGEMLIVNLTKNKQKISKIKSNFNFYTKFYNQKKLKNELKKLEENGLIKSKNEKEFYLYKLYNYSNKTHYKNLWHKSIFLKKIRGLVLNYTFDIVCFSFEKLLNFEELEKKEKENFEKEENEKFLAVEKLNGFLINVYLFNNKLCFSTNKNLISKHINLAENLFNKKKKEKIINLLKKENLTLMFEIITFKDKHIITEKNGIYLIGARKKSFKENLEKEENLDILAKKINVKRANYKILTLKKIKNELKKIKKEGYIIKDRKTQIPLFKIKSIYYKNLKTIVRLNENRSKDLWKKDKNNQFINSKLNENYKFLIEKIKENFTFEKWIELNEYEKLEFLKSNLKNKTKL
jgi:hypothetical protein